MTTANDNPQRSAAASHEPNLLVIAPPGCGKTELLALRAEALISRLQPNQRILALTFTNRAKLNLTSRIRELLGNERFRRYVAVRNFHGHAAEIVLAHGRTVGLLPEKLMMPTSKSLRSALESMSTDYAVRTAASELLAAAKRRPIDDAEVLATLAGNGADLAYRVEVDRVANDQLHYEDLLRHAQRLLHVDEVAHLYRQHYGAVLVDEFQDMSPQQLDLALRSCATSRTFVGDPMQGIYSWAGAEPQAVEEYLRATCGPPVRLEVSYRSSPAVLAMVNGVATRLGSTELRAADPTSWRESGASAAVTCADQVAEAKLITAISQRVLQSEPGNSIGIIARSAWRRKVIDQAISDSGLPSRRWDLSIEDPQIADRIRVVIAALPRGASIETALSRALGTVDSGDVDTAEQIHDAFVALRAGGAPTARAALRQLKPTDPDAPIGPGVHLLNAHTGKGQQFDWVFIPGLEERHLPDRRSLHGAALAEEEQVLLVMLSRAKHGVVVTKVDTLDGQYGPYQPKTSRWWAGLAGSAALDRDGLIDHVKRLYPG